MHTPDAAWTVVILPVCCLLASVAIYCRREHHFIIARHPPLLVLQNAGLFIASLLLMIGILLSLQPSPLDYSSFAARFPPGFTRYCKIFATSLICYCKPRRKHHESYRTNGILSYFVRFYHYKTTKNRERICYTFLRETRTKK